MGIALQDSIAVGIVLLATATLIHRSVKSFVGKQKSGCVGCSSCPVNASKSAPPPISEVVAIGPMVRRGAS